MRKIYLFLVIILLSSSACSLVKKNDIYKHNTFTEIKDVVKQSDINNHQDFNLINEENSLSDKNEEISEHQITDFEISLKVINSEILAERQVIIKNKEEEIFRFSFADALDFEAELIAQSGDNVYFYVSPTGFGGCIYSEFNIKNLYKFNLTNYELTILAKNVSYIDFVDNFSKLGYVQDKFYILQDLQSGQEKKCLLPTRASAYRDWKLLSGGDQVTMIGYVGDGHYSCLWDDKSPIAEEEYSWNLASNELKVLVRGPMGLEKSKETQNEVVLETLYINKDKQISVNFIDGYKEFNNHQVGFGSIVPSLGLDPESVNKLSHSFQLDIKEHQSISELVKYYKTRNVEVSVLNINNFEVAKYTEGGLCEERAIEVVGEKYNYKFFSLGCFNDQETDFNYLAQVVKGARLME